MVIVLIVVGLIVLAGLIYVLVRNSIISARNRVEEAWSGIDVQLKRRHDLVPNLVESVKGYATHERETFEKVTQARSQAMQASGVEETGKAESALSAAPRRSPGRCRAISGAARDRELPAASAAALGARGRDPGIAADLQLERPVLQHPDPAVPGLDHRQPGRLRREAVLRDRRRRRARGPAGLVQLAGPRCDPASRVRRRTPQTVMTTFPRACPSSRYRIASGTSISEYLPATTGDDRQCQPAGLAEVR